MAEMHEAIFRWPDVDANNVIVTGTFDQWACSVHLTKTSCGFEGKVKLPWGARVLYKFVVDGQWATEQSRPTEPDQSGNINNVYECPCKPERIAAQVQSSGDLLSVPVEPKRDEAAIATLEPLTEQGSSERSQHVSNHTKDTILTNDNDLFPLTIGSTPDTARENAAVPILGVAQDFLRDHGGTSDEVNGHIPVLIDTASKPLDAAKDGVEQPQAEVTVVSPVVQAAQGVEIEKTSEESTKRTTKNGSQTAQSNELGPPDSDKIHNGGPALTPNSIKTEAEDSADPALKATSQLVAESVPSAVASSDTEAGPAVDTILVTPHSIPAEVAPVAPIQVQDITTQTSTPSDTLVQASETVIVNQTPAGDLMAKELSEEGSATIPQVETGDKHVVNRLTAAPEFAPAPSISKVKAVEIGTIGKTIMPTSVHAGTTASNQSLTFAEPSLETLDPAPITSEPPIGERTHTTAERLLTEPSPLQVPTGVDIQKESILNSAAKETSIMSNVTSVSVVEATKKARPSPEIAIDKHSTTTPIKTEAANESNGMQAFPTTSSGNSPAPSKSGSARKKRTSIFGKVRDLFSLEKKERK